MKKSKPEFIFEKIEKYTKNLKVPLNSLIAIKRNSDFSILISAILSTRTKDEVTAKVLKNFLKRIKDFYDLREIKLDELEKIIYPIGFYRNKARILKRLAEVILEDYSGKIPGEFNELIKLPGVGRKVANLVLQEIFKKDEICVDTHVHRISNRLGWIKTKNPKETEENLKAIFRKKYWKRINKTLVAFGQGICKPVKPSCEICPVEEFCPKILS
ncbi:MAG: endonuclease III [Candidatus Hydrothermales bacterium]